MAVDYTIDVPVAGAARNAGKTEVARLQDISDTIADINTRIAAYETNGLDAADIGVTVQGYDADLAALAGLAGVQGDIIYHNGTVWTRLAKGTAAQVLAMNAGATAPEWAAASGVGGGGGALTPRFYATRITTNQALTSGTLTAVVYNSELEDTDGAFNTTTGQFTVPASQGGTWMFGHSSTLQGVDSASKQFHSAYVHVNGTATNPRMGGVNVAASGLTAGEFTWIGSEAPFIVAAGDVISMRVVATGSAPAVRTDSRFWGRKVG